MRKILILTLVAAAAVAARAETYDIDTAHTTVGFKARHVVGKVPGRFTKFSGSFTYEKGKPKTWSAEATIDAASIDTDNDKRDAHLKSDAFFDVAKCPTITFKSTKVTHVSGDHAKLHGDLTMHCITKPVVLDLEIDGEGKDPWGNVTASFSATGTVDRKDWGILWNQKLDSGGYLVGDKIEIDLEVSGNPHKADAPAPASTK
jgi:polyisoprenoid-binding protein YceI